MQRSLREGVLRAPLNTREIRNSRNRRQGAFPALTMLSLSSAGEVVLELVRILRQAEKWAPELAKAAGTWLSGQWAFQMLACVSLLILVLQLYYRNSLKTHTTSK